LLLNARAAIAMAGDVARLLAAELRRDEQWQRIREHFPEEMFRRRVPAVKQFQHVEFWMPRCGSSTPVPSGTCSRKVTELQDGASRL